MLQPHTGRISLQRTPPFFLPSLRPLEAIYLTMARRHHILLFRRLAVARSSRARTGIVKRRRVTIASWLRGRRFEFEFSTFVVKSCIVLARYFLRVGCCCPFPPPRILLHQPLRFPDAFLSALRLFPTRG